MRTKRHVPYRGPTVRFTTGLSSEHGQARRQWRDILRTGKDCQLRILYPMKVSLKNEGERKSFQQTNAEKNFMISKTPTLNKKTDEVKGWGKCTREHEIQIFWSGYIKSR